MKIKYRITIAIILALLSPIPFGSIGHEKLSDLIERPTGLIFYKTVIGQTGTGVDINLVGLALISLSILIYTIVYFFLISLIFRQRL